MKDTASNTDRSIVEIILRHYPAVTAVYLFGSRATGDECISSDYDFALLFPPGPRTDACRNIAEECRSELEEFTGRDVDLVNLRSVSTVMQNEIISYGVVVYTADESAVEEFEMYVLSFYQKLGEERAGIIDDIYESGKILSL